jgi:hypothetical protein
MAPAKRQPIVRQTYYFGSKKVQVGQLKGATRVSFIAMPARTAAALGLKLQLPKDIPGTTYTVEGGLIFDQHSTAKGKKVKTPIRPRIGPKKIQVHFDAPGKRQVSAKGVKGKSVPTASTVVTIGIPRWANIETTQRFLANSKAKSFSIDGTLIDVGKEAAK